MVPRGGGAKSAGALPPNMDPVGVEAVCHTPSDPKMNSKANNFAFPAPAPLKTHKKQPPIPYASRTVNHNGVVRAQGEGGYRVGRCGTERGGQGQLMGLNQVGGGFCVAERGCNAWMVKKLGNAALCPPACLSVSFRVPASVVFLDCTVCWFCSVACMGEGVGMQPQALHKKRRWAPLSQVQRWVNAQLLKVPKGNRTSKTWRAGLPGHGI